nr:reverse transcriptase domain-containing protein [Tanacetum cinerariifolium]
MITDVNINKLHQPCRSFDAVINKYHSGKSTGYDSLRLSQAQILWGMYHKKTLDFAYLLGEDFVYQVKHKDAKKSNEIYYPRFTNVIVNFFMTKDQSIPRRNKVNWHFSMDDYMFTTIKLVFRHQNTQQYGAILPVGLTNEANRNFESYKDYYSIASGAEPPKTKASAKDSRLQQRWINLSRRNNLLSHPKLKMKLAIKRSLTQTHISQANRSGADERTGIIPGVLDVPTYESEDEEISWKSRPNAEDDNNELYGDLNINLEGRDIQMANVNTTEIIKVAHVTLTPAWDCFKEMLRACPHHEFLESTQIDTFYKGLTEQDQDSLNAAAGVNLLNKTTRETLKIIENKSKVHYSRSKSNVSRGNTNSRDSVSKTDNRIDKLADQISNLVEIVNKQVIAPAKAVEKTYVTCGGPIRRGRSSGPPSPDYIPGPEEPEQATPSPDYVPCPEHADDEIDDKDEEDDDMDIEADEEEEEHPAPTDSVVVALTAADQAPSAEETEPFETDE